MNDPREDIDSVDRMVEGDENDEEDATAIVGSIDPLGSVCQYTGGMVLGYSASPLGAALVTVSGNPIRPSFSADSKAPRTRNRDILKAYKDVHINDR
ncbi:hypothetical protein L484_014067 [Morus notabilis]|uniref:Uncharacterized protein n=1 Tax=Morus notabilis TaxID=981085 RepID=W9QYV8_9ROSA|nr:hypothetical protein L484_014067 [Morus notabilis]